MFVIKIYFIIHFIFVMFGTSYIKLKIPTSNSKLQQNFPNDPKSDIIINFKNKKTFRLQKAHLRMESNYFMKKLTCASQTLQINKNFNEVIFQNVLSLFYGNQINIDTNNVKQYYEIAFFLEVECLVQTIRNDIIKKITNYDIFEVLNISYITQDKELFQICFDELQKQSFQQLDCNKHELFNLNYGLFKLILKQYNNFFRLKFNTERASASKIVELIEQYCQRNEQYQDKIQDIKYECVQISRLNSEQFKSIFFKQSTQNYLDSSGGKQKSSSNCSDESLSADEKIQQKLVQTLNKSIKMNRILKLQNIYLKKKIAEQEFQNKLILKDISKLLKKQNENHQMHEQLQNNFLNVNLELKNEILKNKTSQLQSSRTISKFEIILQKMHHQLDKKTQQINSMLINFSKKQNKNTNVFSSSESIKAQDRLAISQFLPAAFIAELMDEPQQSQDGEKQCNKSMKLFNQKPKKNSISKSNEIQSLAFKFNKTPIGISKIYLQEFLKIAENDKQLFNKKFSLLYRRSTNHSSKGNRINLLNSNLHNLLIFITTDEMVQKVFVIRQNCTNMKNQQRSKGDNLSLNKNIIIIDINNWGEIFNQQKWLINCKDHLKIAANCLEQKSLQKTEENSNILNQIKLIKFQVYQIITL